MQNAKVSVIIPNYNGEKLLDPCLDSVERQEYPNYEILVVDDHSSDTSLELLQTRRVKTLVNTKNLGFSGTVNAGIERADGTYVLLLNNDVVLAPGFLEALVKRIEESEKTFSVSSKMIRYYERDLLDDTGDEYTVFGWVYKRGDGDPVDAYSKPDAVFSACAGAALYKRETLLRLGGFDVLHESYLEDVDLGWRARIFGYDNLYAPEALCYHIGSATLADGKKYSETKVYLSARNNVYIIVKNMPVVQILLNLPTLLLGFGIKYLYFRHLGYEKPYRRGLLEGVQNAGKLIRVPVRVENIKNYVDIQIQMLVSSVRYTVKKAKSFWGKMFGKMTFI